MTVRDILHVGHPLLRERSREVTLDELASAAMQTLIDDLVASFKRDVLIRVFGHLDSIVDCSRVGSYELNLLFVSILCRPARRSDGLCQRHTRN